MAVQQGPSRPLAVAALALGLLAAAAAAQPAAGPAELTDVTVVSREAATEVWVRTTRAVRYQGELMDGPFRLVLDFEDTAYRWRAAPLPVAVDPVRELRGSQYRKGVARLVIELRRKVAYTIEQDREGLRIVLAADATPPRDASSPAPPRGASRAAGEAPTPAARPPGPLVYGIVMLDDVATAYIFDPATRQVRRYRVGDALGDAVVETIAERHVVLRTPGGPVELRVDDAKPDAPSRPPAPRR